jgi:D-3-phosphoglycerate dehydrogenase / 2-oxoglutarate reductase
MTANAKRLAYFEDWIDPIAMETLGKRPEIEVTRLAFASPEADNWSALASAHGYHVLPRGDLIEPWFGDANLLARSPKLLAMSSTGAGYDMIDVEACTKAGVIVVCQTGTNKEAVAEHALGLMIALSKKMMVTDKALRRGQFVDRYAFTGNDLMGKTVGIVGIGHIGTRTAELCKGLLRMRVLACDPYLTADEVAKRGAEKVGLDQLLAQSDFVTVHCPRSTETLGIFGLAQFAAMKPSAYFINTARGGIHKEDDLALALSRGLMSGAGVDVFLKEPPSADHPLLAFDNVIASPHIAGVTHEAMHEMARAAAEQWIGLFEGEVPPRLVNPEAWPRYCERFERELGFMPKPLAG